MRDHKYLLQAVKEEKLDRYFLLFFINKKNLFLFSFKQISYLSICTLWCQKQHTTELDIGNKNFHYAWICIQAQIIHQTVYD